jgi:hypothetical protein
MPRNGAKGVRIRGLILPTVPLSAHIFVRPSMSDSRLKWTLAALAAGDALALEHDLAPDPDVAQKGLIVAHDDQRAVKRLQRLLQLLDRGDIEMVGRLVQDQQ